MPLNLDLAPGPAGDTGYTISCLSPSGLHSSPLVGEQWRAIAERDAGVGALYASPDWFEHLCATEPDSTYFAAVVQDGTSQLLGVVSGRQQSFSLRYDLFSRSLGATRLRAVKIIAGSPLLPADVEVYDAVFGSICESWPEADCLFLESVPTDTFLWRYLHQSGGSNLWRLYLPYGLRPWHSLRLEDSFEAYLAGMGRKARYNLRRTVASASEEGGSLELLRIECEDDVAKFLDGATEVSRASWQHRVLGPRLGNGPSHVARFCDLAARGILRGYLLKIGGTPAAFAVGHQYRNVFHFVETGFCESLAGLSPGTVLLYRLIEDLHVYRKPALLSFGIGDATYKRRFGNCTGEDAAVLLLRRTLVNRLRQVGHAAFQEFVRFAKCLLGRKVQA